MTSPNLLRNVAIIAHIDHGKTTLIDSIFKSAHVFRDNQRVEERVMDNFALERERGITIRAKHCSVEALGHRINIVDTPGHADFSGEVERVLSMVDSVLLLVDANEGPMPQTRYVTMRALKLGYKPIVIVNKVDRPNANPEEALNKTFDLFVELGANDDQADFPVLYGSGLDGWFVKDLADERSGMDPLFQMMIEKVPPPQVHDNEPFRMQISSIDWNDYIGRVGCGRVKEGVVRKGDIFQRVSTKWTADGRKEGDWEIVDQGIERVEHLWRVEGLDKVEVDEVHAGDICWIAGPKEIAIGDTFAAQEWEDPALPPLEIEEPTVSMFFLVNTGPFAGQEGQAITARQLKDRLEKELRTNVSLRLEDVGRADGFKVSGRGELHLGILIEEMRREGMELCVSRPEVILHQEDGVLMEPMEQVLIDVPEEYQGAVIEKLAKRKGELKAMENGGRGMVRLEIEAPTRGLIGYRNEFLTDTRGLGILASRFIGYAPYRGEIPARNRGALVSRETGEATGYQIENLQARAVMFVSPMDRVYEGQVIGENSRPEDMPCNPTKRKNLTNHRSSTKDNDAPLKAPRKLSLDGALEWLSDDELLEVTPQSVRIRKAVLNEEERKKASKRRESLAEAAAAR